MLWKIREINFYVKRFFRASLTPGFTFYSTVHNPRITGISLLKSSRSFHGFPSIFVKKSDLTDTGSEITQLHILNKQILR